MAINPAPAGWPRRYTLVLLCFAASFICYIDRVNLSVAILPMQDEFGWSDTTKGLVMSSFFVGYLLLQVAGGWLAGRYGGRRVLGLAVIWWSAFTMLTPAGAFASLGILFAVRAALGLGEAAAYPATVSLYGRWVPPAERTRAMTIMLSGVPAGTLFGLMTTGWIIDHLGWPAVFYAFGVVGFAWAIVWFAMVSDDPSRDPRVAPAERALIAAQCLPPGPAPQVPWRRLLSSPAVLALIFNHFCSNWTLYIMLAWLPSYFRDAHHVSVASAGLRSALPWLSMFVMSNAAGWMADRAIGAGVSATLVRKIMQSVGLLGAAACVLGARQIGSVDEATAIMCGTMAFLAFTWAGFAPNHMEIAPRYADVLFGMSNTAGTIPGIVAVAVTGWLVDTTGTYAAAFVTIAVVNIAGTAVWLAFGTSKRVID
ncbi:MAG: ACS family MFS transporter [Gammaproteobacteria bacterium]